MERQKQTTELVNYFEGVDSSITPLIAQKVLGIERLASRVWDLKQLGYQIEKITKRDFTGKRYTEYVFCG